MPRTYDPKLVEKTIKTIQMLSVDAVENARAGHPGTPMALAAIRAWLG
jgi:transketolase